jgi:SAM-dependent methyltransferase
MENHTGMQMKCYLCGSILADVIATKEEIRFGCFASDKIISQCRSCGLVQLSPPWTSEELDQLYADYWKKKDFPKQKVKVKISKYLTEYISKGDRVLEVGCGHGHNIEYLTKKGYDVIGIDKSPAAMGFTMDYKDWSKEVDCIYAIHLFEHLSDPKHFIRWMRQYGKKFIIEIPCIDDILMSLPAYRKFCWYPYHMFFYSKETARKMFGPEVKIFRRQEYGLLNHLRWLFMGRPGNSLPKIPIIDNAYKKLLTMLGFSDTLIVVSHV